MGTTKISSSTTSQAKPTPQEKEMNKLLLEQYQQIQPQQTGYYSDAFNLASNLLKGQNLPGYLQGLPGGISGQDVGTQAAQYAINNMPGMQSLGIMDSGVAANSIAKGIAKEVTLPVAEYNSNLLLSLLNLATGQASQGTSSFQGSSGMLANQLAGLRKTTGTQTQTQNPFLQSFYGSLGKTLGSPSFPVGNSGAGFGMPSW
jgi:hypothetical protein